MALSSTHLRFAAVALAVATVALAGSAAQAFTFENQSAPNAGAQFADPDDQVKNLGGKGYQLGQDGPVVRFGAQSSQQVGMPPFGRFQGSGFQTPPEPYARPLGNSD
jgi:hypothetical protein